MHNVISKSTKKRKIQLLLLKNKSKTKEEILYFDSLLQQMEAASSKDIEEIREELAEEGYMRNRKTKTQRKSLLNQY